MARDSASSVLYHDDLETGDDFGHRLLQAWVQLQANTGADPTQHVEAAQQEASQQEDEASAAYDDSENEEVAVPVSTGPVDPATRPPRHEGSQSARPQQQQQQGHMRMRRHSQTEPLPQLSDASPALEARTSNGSGTGPMSILSKLVGAVHAARSSNRPMPGTARRHNGHAAAAAPASAAATPSAPSAPQDWDPEALHGDTRCSSPPVPRNPPGAKRWTHPYDDAAHLGPHAHGPDWPPDGPWRLQQSSPYPTTLSDQLHAQHPIEDAARSARSAAHAQHAYALGLGSSAGAGAGAGKTRRFGSNSSSEFCTEPPYGDRDSAEAGLSGFAKAVHAPRPGIGRGDSPICSPRLEQFAEAPWSAPLLPGTPALLGHVRIHQQAVVGTAVLDMCSTADALRVSAAATSAAVAAVGGRVGAPRAAAAAAGGGAVAASLIAASRGGVGAAAASDGRPSTATAIAALLAAAKGRGPLTPSTASQQYRRGLQQQQLRSHSQAQQGQGPPPGTPPDFWQRQLVASSRRRHSSGLEAASASAAVAAADAERRRAAGRLDSRGSAKRPLLTGQLAAQLDHERGGLHSHQSDQAGYGRAEPQYSHDSAPCLQTAERPSARMHAGHASPAAPSTPLTAPHPQAGSMPPQQQPAAPSTRHEAYSKAAMLFGQRRSIARLYH